MRFIETASITLSCVASYVAADSCGQIRQNELAATGSEGKPSYCKYWQNPKVCFNYYFVDGSKTAYFWFVDGVTPETAFPMTCADADRIVGDIPPPAPVSGADDCQALCEMTPGCNTIKGTYCKSWQAPQVCQALYYDVDGTIKYFMGRPVDVPENIPVKCADATRLVNGAAPVAPVEPVVPAPVEPVVPAPVEPVVPAPVEPVVPVVPAPVEPVVPVVPAPVEPAPVAPSADPCIALCNKNKPACVESYCKDWNTPAVCQKLYWNSESMTDGFHYFTAGSSEAFPVTCEQAAAM